MNFFREQSYWTMVASVAEIMRSSMIGEIAHCSVKQSSNSDKLQNQEK